MFCQLSQVHWEFPSVSCHFVLTLINNCPFPMDLGIVWIGSITWCSTCCSEMYLPRRSQNAGQNLYCLSSWGLWKKWFKIHKNRAIASEGYLCVTIKNQLYSRTVNTKMYQDRQREAILLHFMPCARVLLRVGAHFTPARNNGWEEIPFSLWFLWFTLVN